jgi:integrase
MPPVTASAPAADRRRGGRPRSQRLLTDYRRHLARTGRGNPAYDWAARSFLRRWPDPQAWVAQPLSRRLRAGKHTRPLLTFLMLHRWLHPGYDYLVERKLSSLWRELDASPLGPDLARFVAAARQAGFTERVASATASQIIARLLIQTGRPLDALGHDDFAELIDACRKRQLRTGRGWRHYRGTIHSARQVLFHLGVLDSPAPPLATGQPFVERMSGVSPLLRDSFVAYLQAKTATCRPKTVSSLATRLAHFGRFLAETDPHLASLADLDRRRHIEPFLAALTQTPNSKRDGLLSPADRARRVLAISTFLADITEWGWPDAPLRRLVFKSDIPRLPHPLPRYVPPDADRRLAEALKTSPNRLAADALLLQRACGLRIGELLDLELDCVHEIPGQGAWLKVPLGKLDTERMVPLDDESVAIVDRIVAHRCPGRPLPHPRTGKPADFLFTHHGRRLTQNPLRQELNRAAAEAGLAHITPHQLRHTYATALVNAGVSRQALMALLGHVSAEMSLRYGRLFDATVRTEYERALTLAKAHLGPLPQGRANLPLTDVTGGDWRDTPTIKARLAGGFCMRAPAQGACPYANICEHCPNFRTDAGYLPVLAAQRLDADTLARDAEARGWIDEADRHRRLLTRLDTLIAQAQAG